MFVLRSTTSPRRLLASIPRIVQARTMATALPIRSKQQSSDPLKQYLADDPPTIVNLQIKPHFEALSDKEKLYSHHISVASFAGTRIVLRQCSPESEQIYDLILALHKYCNGDWKKLGQQAGLSDDETKAFLSYAAQFLGNCGNYKSFGDAKFLPRLAATQLKALASLTPETIQIWEQVKDRVFGDAVDIGKLHLGYPDAGHVSNYYPQSPEITKDEISAVSDFLEKKGLLPENTRIRKTMAGFEVLIASAVDTPQESQRDLQETEWTVQEGSLKGQTIMLTFGDHKNEMKTISDNLEKAAGYAANDTQKNMLLEYTKAYRTGSLQAFLQSQRFWIRDKQPTIETNIGFIETYRDPQGIRGEWEGFVAMVNKERTKAFGALVEGAPSLITKLPWSKDFEKDKFLSPDFTSLEVLTFAGSGIPAGINIPNSDVIRQSEGFKNVSLGNVLGAKGKDEPIPFIKESDLKVYSDNRDASFEVQVGLHELLGHGCGKLLQETSKGEYNFDINNPPTSPLTNKPITSYYKPGQTWGSVFGSLAGAYEECRAEAVAMFLICDFSILKIFGFGDGSEDIDGPAGDIIYAGYLSMARAGIAALEFWDPKSKKWGQPHMQARFSILQTFLAAGKDFASLDYTSEDLSDLTLRINRGLIQTTGRKAVEKYLQELHILKSTGDVVAGTKMFTDITTVDDFFADKVRPAVLAKKTPRKVFVQANTFAKDGTAELKEYEPTPEGMIQSFAERTYI